MKRKKVGSDGEPDFDEIMRKKKFESQAYMQVYLGHDVPSLWTHGSGLSKKWVYTPCAVSFPGFILGCPRAGGSKGKTTWHQRIPQIDHRRYENHHMGN